MQIIHFLSDYFIFIVASFFSFYVPGDLFLLSIRIKKEIPFFERQALSWFAGISLFLCVTYFTAYLHMQNVYPAGIYFLGVLWIFYLIRFKQIRTSHLKINDIWSLILILLGSLTFLSIMFFSGFQTKEGLIFLGVNSVDGIRHIAYIADQVKNFPRKIRQLAASPYSDFTTFMILFLVDLSCFILFP